MLFRCTENPPENTIFPPAALRVSARAFGYTEKGSFPYTVSRARPTGLWKSPTVRPRLVLVSERLMDPSGHRRFRRARP